MLPKIILIAAIFVLLVTFLVVLPGKVSDSSKTLATLEQIDNHPLYKMTYYGGYGLEEILKTGVKNDEELIKAIKKNMKNIKGTNLDINDINLPEPGACSAYSAMNESGEPIMGRNMDWHDRPTILLYTDPPNAYSSVSMADIGFLGYSEQNSPLKQGNKTNLLAAPYLTSDGMNECGLAIATLSVPEADGGNNPSKITINNSLGIRIVLDYAKDVEEAVSILQKYNIYFSLNSPAHYFVADVSGKSAAIEFIDGKVVATRNDKPWSVLTNFIVNGKTGDVSEQVCDRYHKMFNTLKEKEGKINKQEAMDILQSVSVRKTVWSEVFNLATREINIVMDSKYGEVMTFKLERLTQDRTALQIVKMPEKRAPKDKKKFIDTIADNENVVVELKNVRCTGTKKDLVPHLDLIKQIDKAISDNGGNSAKSLIDTVIYTDEKKFREVLGIPEVQLLSNCVKKENTIYLLLIQKPGQDQAALYKEICEEFVKIILSEK